MPKPQPTHDHELVIKVRFNKRCTRAVAIREVRDCIHGKFFTTQLEDHEPGVFSVKGYRHPQETI